MKKRGSFFARPWVRWTAAFLLAALIVIIVGGNGLTPFSMSGAVR
ncbi:MULTISPECIES: hypothetical protein [unclassified Hyphomonas]|jgi:hypothetical protein|uniref:Uncharacterized protein n=1 Tax=hydrothermal vent metagenome TaxID=652676 RepID=A0A161K726_9ZZZZ|nr:MULTISPECIES: hypothetical protein [unclassified Hyphomonas]|tara:strand:+ start:1363 stop:1497 length:135 start_codon:yes stop_codon:yes gene_type:complete